MNTKNEEGYKPNYDKLISESPNDEMREAWIESKERDLSYAYNCIYMMKMSCNHYEIFQHQVRDEDDLKEWVKLMQSEKYYKKCTRCICGA